MKSLIANRYVQLLCACVIFYCVGYYFKDQKVTVVEVEKEKIIYKYIKGDTIVQKPDGTVIVTNGTINSSEQSSENTYKKEEINKRSMDFLLGFGRDLDRNENKITGDFIFEPFNKILVGAAYERNISVKSNSIFIKTGLRF